MLAASDRNRRSPYAILPNPGESGPDMHDDPINNDELADENERRDAEEFSRLLEAYGRVAPVNGEGPLDTEVATSEVARDAAATRGMVRPRATSLAAILKSPRLPMT